MLDPRWIAPSYLSSAAFLRLLAPQVLHEHRRCVYLDSDLIVRHDPRTLHDLDLADRTLGAVRSRVAPFLASPGGVGRWMDLGLRGSAPYFNSGVMTIDLERWRLLQVTERCSDLLGRYGKEMTTGDQEALNAALVDEWAALDLTWNYVTHVTGNFMQQPELEPVDPFIAHFAGRAKPWEFGMNPIYSDEWFELLESTPWRGFVPHPPSPKRGPRAAARRWAQQRLRSLLNLVRE